MLSIDGVERRKVALITASVVFVVALCGVAGVWAYGNLSPSASTPQPVVVSAPKPVVTTTSLESRMLVMGDIFFGRYINDWSMKSPLGYAYPFQKLSEFERETYDAWIANLECPVTNNPKVTPAQEEATLAFDCSPNYVPELKKWFTAVSLANNHTDNQGAQVGLDETRQHLATNGVQNFGTFDPEDLDNVCEILSLPARAQLSDGSEKQGKIPLVWCGYHGVYRTPSASSIAVMQRYASQFNIVAMPHSGAEYKPAPDEIKTTFYRALIDGGADVVVGGHAHWVQNTEAYKGKLIMYSVGNFIFDQISSAEVTRSAVLDMTVSAEAAQASDLDKWLALGEMCATHKDNCLAAAEQQQLKKLPLKYHFAALGSNDSGKMVRRATDVELASIKQRLDWAQTITGLTGVNSGE